MLGETNRSLDLDTRRRFVIFILFFVPLTLIALVYLFQDFLVPFYGEQHYLAMHLILELFCIIVSFSIAIQAWMIYPYTLRGKGIYIGALFFSVGLLDFFHMISFKGMPVFITEGSIQVSAWFWIAARLTLALFLLVILLIPENSQSSKGYTFKKRGVMYSLSFVYSIIWIVGIYLYSSQLPLLFLEGVGTTTLTNGLEYFVILLHIGTIGLFVKNRTKVTELQLTFILALFYLIIAGWMLTQHVVLHDIKSLLGHMVKGIGFYFLTYSLYITSVKRPFQLQSNLQKKLEQHAYYDDVTGLPNMRHLHDNLTKLINNERPFGIIMFDIHQLQKVNNSLGQGFMNEILKLITNRLQQSLPSHYYLSRMTGDHMALLILNVKTQEELLEVCKQIAAVFDKSFKARHLELMINITLGMTIYPIDGNNSELLLDNAKAALDEAKINKLPHLFYRPELRSKTYNKLLLENDLRRALENEELSLVYQPKIDIVAGRIYGFEALLRWEHAKRGAISPLEFIPIAEETGLIVPIGDWVIQTASKQLKAWHKIDPTLKMAVNFSFRQFYQPDLTIKIKNILQETNLQSNYLELELTESMAIEIDVSIDKIKKLKELGVRISIDDFGTGYSSLNYLKELPIDKLKIDRTFIRGLHTNEQDQMIVSTIISIAKNMKVEVIAEGVEEVAQLNILQKKQCNHVQGYLFSKPERPDYITKNFTRLQADAKKYFLA